MTAPGTCAAATGELNGSCVELGYGAECGVHDRNLPECNVTSAPAWCSRQWCFVDPARCLHPHRASTGWFSETPEYFSYETCGNLDDYADTKYVRELTGRSVRVTFPYNGPNGYIYYPAAGDERGAIGNMKGAFAAFVSDIFKEFGMRAALVNLTDVSRVKFPDSSYTACVHDVALNVTDLCIGEFWPTPSRLLMVPFSPELYADQFYLVTTSDVSTPTFLAMLATPFAPFDLNVWLLIIAISLFVGLALFVVEVEHNDDDFPDKRWAHGLLDALYLCVMSYFDGTSQFEIKTKHARIINSGYGFFLLVVGASCTSLHPPPRPPAP